MRGAFLWCWTAFTASSSGTLSTFTTMSTMTPKRSPNCACSRGLGVAQDKLIETFGFTGLPRYERLLALEDDKKAPRVIEGTAVEIKKDQTE